MCESVWKDCFYCWFSYLINFGLVINLMVWFRDFWFDKKGMMINYFWFIYFFELNYFWFSYLINFGLIVNLMVWLKRILV